MGLDSATVKIVLKIGKSLLNKKGEYPVKLRVTYFGKQKFYTVRGHSATSDEFESIMNPNSKGARGKRRLKYEKIEQEAKNIIDELNQFSFQAFEKEYLNKRSNKKLTIHDYFENKAKELDQLNKRQTSILYRATIKSLADFDKNISFQKLTPNYLKNYEEWFVSGGKIPQKKNVADKDRKGGTYTTVGIYMRNLRHIVNLAINDKMPIDYPFGKKEDKKYPIPESNNTKKALSINDIGKILSYEPKDRNEYLALNYWLFSYLCNGMNMADIVNLKFRNIKQGHIEFIRQKTKDTTKDKTPIQVIILPEVQKIIDSIGNEPKPNNYIFPIYQLDFTADEKFKRLKQHIKTTNKYFNRITDNLGIFENTTTYWARHSYSTILKRSGAPIEFISEQLGHKDTKVTRHYLDSFEDEQRIKYSANLIPNRDDRE